MTRDELLVAKRRISLLWAAFGLALFMVMSTGLCVAFWKWVLTPACAFTFAGCK